MDAAVILDALRWSHAALGALVAWQMAVVVLPNPPGRNVRRFAWGLLLLGICTVGWGVAGAMGSHEWWRVLFATLGIVGWLMVCIPPTRVRHIEYEGCEPNPRPRKR